MRAERFAFRAVDRGGRLREGQMTADGAGQVNAQLAARGWEVLQVAPVDAATGGEKGSAKGGGEADERRLLRLSLRQRALFTRQLAALAAVCPLEEALRTMARQAQHPRERAVVGRVHAGVCEGLTLAEAMKRAGRAFPTVYRAMIAAGENAGRLPLIAGRLADLTDRQAHVRGRLGAALAYPAALCLVALGVVTGLMVAVVPRVVEQFDAASRQLPWLTRVVIALSNGLAAWGWLFGLLAVLAGFGLVRGLGWPPFRARFDAALLRVPLLGSLWRDAQAAALARTLATMIEAQLPLLDGLRLAAGTADNTVHRRALIDVAGGVREGGSLAGGLAQAGVFPPLLVAMAASGEASGQLGPLLTSAADALDRAFEATCATALALLEPAIIVVMGALVALIILSILLPILQLQTLTGP